MEMGVGVYLYQPHGNPIPKRTCGWVEKRQCILFDDLPFEKEFAVIDSFLKIVFIYLFVAVPGLHCSEEAFSICSE